MVAHWGYGFAVLATCQVLAGAALAGDEIWTCSVSSRCVSGESCFDLATPATFALTMAADGKSATFDASGERATMRLIDAQRQSRSFFQRMGPGTIGFMTLYSDGTLTLSSHDGSGGDIAATASEGKCTRVES